MKRVTLQLSLLVLVGSIIFSACCGPKKLSKAWQKEDPKKYITVAPSPLEMHGNYKGDEKVAIAITINFPPKTVCKKALVSVTPYLEYNGQRKTLKPQSIQGESVKDNNPVVGYASGGTVTLRDTVSYDDAMRISTMGLKASASLTGKPAQDLPEVKDLAKGVIDSPRLLKEGLEIDSQSGDGSNGSNVNDGSSPYGQLGVEKGVAPKDYTATQALDVYYNISSSAKRGDYTKTLKQLQDSLAKVNAVMIVGNASPDGPESDNNKLAQDRTGSAKKDVDDLFKKAKLTTGTAVKTSSKDEDWDGFKQLMQASSMKDKDMVLRVLDMYKDPVQREAEIKKLSTAYDQMRNDVLPKLRRSIITLDYLKKARTQQEILALAVSNPSSLPVEELFYGATVELDMTKKVQVYQTFINLYPNDWRGYNNLGVLYVKQNKLSEAQQQFEQARVKNANNPMVSNNLAVVLMAQGKWAEAEKLLEEAKKNGSQQAAYNLGVIKMRRGQYADALKEFGSTPSFNKALAEHLLKQTDNASKTAGALKSTDAHVDYLKAIIAARQGKNDDVFNNLRSAVAKDNNLKAYASKDMEFGKLFEDDTFKSIVK